MELHVKKTIYQLVNNVNFFGNFQSSRIRSRNKGNHMQQGIEGMTITYYTM
jgi:hypothetical protein